MRVLLFANPIAGAGRGKTIALALQKRLALHKIHVQLFLDRTTQIESIDTADPILATIVIGGDGTLRAVAEFLLQQFPPEKVPPLVVIPLGTANLMRAHLNLDWTPGDIERAIEQRRIFHLDIARANGQLFLLMAGIGIDAAIVHALDKIRSGPITKLSYLLPSALALKDYKFPTMSVELDGKPIFSTAPAMAFVGNVREYGTGFPILPDARSDDGLLDVCVLPCKNPQKLIEIALRTAAGEHLQMRGVVFGRGKRVRIQADTSVPVQLDGDAAGHTPLEIELLPFRLPFIVP